ncbi:MAG: methyltransferase [bacterium]
MGVVLPRVRFGRLLWTVLVMAYFLVFFRNFFTDALPRAPLPSAIFAWAVVIWLSFEYCFGSPFFQSGVVEPSGLWRGVFACFAYPFFGYVVADHAWWHHTQLPVYPVASWIPGMVLFLAGTALRFATLAELVRAAGRPARARARGLFESRPFRVNRHPRYLGTLLQFLGAALVFNSWGGLVLAATVGLGLVLIQVRVEDAEMAHQFGGEFKGYADRVPMFWPRLRRSAR